MNEIGMNEKNFDIELLKLYIDHSKYITTIDTGSILIMAAFLDKLSTQPEWKILIGISFISFILSIIGCVFFQLIILAAETTRIASGSRDAKAAFISVGLSYIGFLTGIIALAVFALKNFI